MKTWLKSFVKNNKFVYRIYYYAGSAILRFIGLFVKPDPNQILFTSYGGRKFDDSPRVVYEYLQEHPISEKHKFIWAFTQPEDFPDVVNSVRIDTIRYYLTALRSGYWITNASIARGLNFKPRNTKNILFVHGMTGIKRIAFDVLQKERAFVVAYHETFDHVFIEGKKEIPILSKVWNLDTCVFHTTGLPRNDDLIDFSPAEVDAVKRKLGIPGGKQVILYAPTFRDYDKAPDGSSALHLPMSFDKWKTMLGEEYVLLITAHYEVAKFLDSLPHDDFVVNAFGYPYINDLIKVSDILVTDYSSIVFDYSILERPIFCYGYDYNTFRTVRGTYMDIEKLFCNGVIQDEDTLLKTIKNMDYAKQCNYTKNYIKDEFLASYGDAARKAVNIIFESEIGV